MSMHDTITITCPECGKDAEFRIWKSINTKIDPEMKAAVRDRSAFLFTCPNCGAKHYVDYGFLYHQMEDSMMIQYADSDEEAEQAAAMFSGAADPVRMFEDLRRNNYLLRIVRSQNELLEKLMIFDAGLDDRIIEILKLFIMVRYHEEHPDEKELKLLFFRSNRKYYVQVFSEGAPKRAVEVTSDFYESIRKDYAPHLKDLREDDPVIDSDWAFHKITYVNSQR